MGSALEELAAAADEVAEDQRRVARRARAMQRQRDRGRSWTTILAEDPPPGLVGLVRESGRHMAEAAAHFTRALAAELSAEGESRRRIARVLGVTHQRVTAMLKGERLSGNH